MDAFLETLPLQGGFYFSADRHNTRHFLSGTLHTMKKVTLTEAEKIQLLTMTKTMSYMEIGESLGLTCKQVFRRMKEAGVSYTSAEKAEKTKQGTFKKYGVACVFSLKEIQEKTTSTKLQKYGVGNPEASRQIVEKREATNIARYGHKTPAMNEAVKRKIRDSHKARTDKQTAESSIIREATRAAQAGGDIAAYYREKGEKRKTTNKERFGVENFNQSDAARAASMEKYGVSCFLKTKKARDAQGEAVQNMHKNNPDDFKVKHLLLTEEAWGDIAKMSVQEVAEKHGVKYTSLLTSLNKEYKERFSSTYTKRGGESHPERLLFREVSKWAADSKKGCRGILPKGKELDIYIPSKKIAIEFNGTYWHSEEFLPKNYHAEKTKECNALGIQLIHVWEDEWEARKAQILGYIKAKISQPERKITAHKTTLSSTPARKFMDAHHMQGPPTSTKAWFNLEHEGRVVASLTLSGHHRQGKEGEIVLSRLCFEGGTAIMGGSERLLKAAKAWAKARGYERVISWSDNAVSNGAVYERLGFSLDVELPVDYFYSNGRQRVSKQSQKKSAVGCPEGMTEYEWASERGLLRTWDCGKRRWAISL